MKENAYKIILQKSRLLFFVLFVITLNLAAQSSLNFTTILSTTDENGKNSFKIKTTNVDKPDIIIQERISTLAHLAPEIINNLFTYKFYIAPSLKDKFQILKYLIPQSSSTSYHLFSHGRPGQLLLDDEWKHPNQIADWLKNSNLSKDVTHLNLYGCEFAKGEKGKAAVKYLEEVLALSIAASDDITGIDGDWELEIGKHNIVVPIVDYPYNLQTCSTIASDNFSSGGSSGGTGWENNWSFIDASIVSGELFMEGGELGTAERTVNLSSYTSAELAFTFKCIDSFSGFESQDSVRLQISTDGGTTFTNYWFRDGNQICPTTNDNETYTETVTIPGGNANTIIRLEARTTAPNEDAYWDNIEISSFQPTAKAYAIQASCTNGIPNDDGYLQISAVLNGDRYHYSTGSSFNDNSGSDTYANAQVITGTTAQTLNNLPNPSSATDYTIRLYNGSNSCYEDMVVTLHPQDCSIGCACQDYIYLNDLQGDAVHKFKVESDSTLTEILNNDNPWYPGDSTSELLSPHGIGMDLNGFLYIAEDQSGNIRKLSCDGTLLPTTTFEIEAGGFNFGTIGNLLIVNDPAVINELEVFDLCTGELKGDICFNITSAQSWGLYVDPRTDTIYYTSPFNTSGVFKATLDDLNSGTCIDPFLSSTTGMPNIGDNFLPNTSINPYGITTDILGNIYIVMIPFYGNTARAQILKYSPSGILLAQSILDNDGGDGTVGKFTAALGITYSEITNLLYTSNGILNAEEDCISVFDTDLNYVGTGFPNPPSGSGQLAKGIGIVTECCPINNNVTVDTTLCATSINDQLFLQELINCDGTICEGIWQEGADNSGMTYNSCNNSITINALNACGTFTLESDGTGSNTPCGAFKVTVNISVNVVTASVIAADQTICAGEDPAAFTITSPATGGTLTYQWQSSTTNCTMDFSDILGATSTTYDPPAGLTDTTYYRAIVTSANAGCSTGLCADTSNCITVTVLPNDASIFAISASCVDGIALDDGYLQISSVAGATHYNYNMGSIYTGSTDITDATAIDVNTLPFQFGTLPNPSGSQDYTVRIFSTDTGCTQDYTITLQEQDCSVGCNCEEYIYLNEPDTDATLKFRINSDGSVTELFNQTTGGHWAEGLTISPHGLGSDKNGFLYIGNSARDAVTQLPLAGVDKYTCDGTLVEEDFLPPHLGDGMTGGAGAATNIYSVGNTLYMNGWYGTGYNDAVIFAYDLCTKDLIGTYTVCDMNDALLLAWDFHIDEANNRIIINNYRSGGIAIGDLDTHLDGPCVPVVINDNERRGITIDTSGNIYVRNTNTFTKYNSAYALQYTIDLTVNGGSNAWGIVYSETTGYLYLSGNDADCISVYDPADGSYVMQGVVNPPNASVNKAIAIATECCPTSNNITIDTILCSAAVNDTFLLKELIGCEGIICEGMWAEGVSNTGLIYNSCDNSVVINSTSACGTFTLASDGTGNSPQCGAFKITVNITVNSLDLTLTQTSCVDNNDGTFTTNYDATVNWNSQPCTSGEMIDVTHNGVSIGMIDPSTDTSPSTFPIAIDANGNGIHAFKAEFTTAGCADSLSFKAPLPCPNDVATCASTSDCIGGNVFEDFNCNGADDMNESGVQGIEVQVYDCNNTLVGTSYSDSDGDWQLCGLTDGTAYRVEFILPESIACYAQPTHVGTDNNSDVQFLTAPACTQFSISNPNDYCVTDPLVATACFLKGNPANATSDEPAIIGDYFSTRNNITPIIHDSIFATIQEVGSVSGLANANKNAKIYIASALKRGAGFGPGDIGIATGSSGAIYELDLASGSVSTLIDLDPASPSNPNPSLFSTGTNPHPNSTTDWNCDAASVEWIARMSWGDIDISLDESTLYAMNLFDRSLYKISTVDGSTLGKYTIPGVAGGPAWNTATCTNNPDEDLRPSALYFNKDNGLVYVGMVCSAASTGNDSDLQLYVFEFDPATNSWNTQPVLEGPIDRTDYRPFTAWDTQANAYPQGFPHDSFGPLLTDIEFVKGDILVALKMIGGELAPNEAQQATSNTTCDGANLYSNTSGYSSSGALYRACFNGNDWTLESGGELSCTPPVTGFSTNDGKGPGDGSYYNQGTVHNYDFQGYMAQLPHEDTLLITGLSGGLRGSVLYLSHTALEWSEFNVVYDRDANQPNTYNKSGGLGDIELLCNSAPLEIGNYVWCDSIENGIQDACERGINNILVSLYDRNGLLVGQDTSSNSGQYYFNQNNVDTTGINLDGSGIATPVSGNFTGMSYNTQYFIVFGGGQFATDEFTVGSNTYGITSMANIGSNDNIDSDVDGSNLTTGGLGARPDGLPFIDLTTSATGCGDHKYDLGVTCPLDIDYPDYTDTCADAPCHITSADIYLGEGVTAEENANSNATASEDMDDGVNIFPSLDVVPGGTFHLPVTMYNNTGTDSYLYVWVDWNGDGDFIDQDEVIPSITYPIATHNGTFTSFISFNVPSDLTNLQMGLRFRYTTDASANAVGPCGTGTCASDGEVEDYVIPINCKAKICLPVTLIKGE